MRRFKRELGLEKVNYQQKDLLSKLVKAIGILYRTERKKSSYLSKDDLSRLQNALLSRHFRFSTMFRAYIPQPNKPGKLRPITPPARRDRRVMDGMAILLNIVFESTFLPCSHGFRPGKGPLTFMTCVENWRDVDRLIKADVVACFVLITRYFFRN